MYATVQDLIDRFGERELIELTDPDLQAVRLPKVEQAIADATALADGSLARVYRLPLDGCIKPAPTAQDPHATVRVMPPQLVRIVCDVARHYLHDDLAPESEVTHRFRAAQDQLKAISEGRSQLTCPWGGDPGVTLASGALREGETFFEFAPRVITPDVAGGYR